MTDTPTDQKTLEAAKAVEDDMRWMAADRHSDIQPLVRERLIEGADMIERFRSALSRRVPASGELDPKALEAADADMLRKLVPGFRLDWSGLRNRFDDIAARIDKLTTYESRSAYLDELARQFEDAVVAALASLPLPVAGTPEGWRLVPEEPTPDMLRAGDIALDRELFLRGPNSANNSRATQASLAEAYRAMLHDAPAAPEGKAEPVSDPKRKHGYTVNLTEEEMDALEALAKEHSLPPWRVLLQGLRLYQSVAHPVDLGPKLDPSLAAALSTLPGAPHE